MNKNWMDKGLYITKDGKQELLELIILILCAWFQFTQEKRPF